MKVNVVYTLCASVSVDVDDKFQKLVHEDDDVLMTELRETLYKNSRTKAKQMEAFPATWEDIVDLNAIWDGSTESLIAEY